MSDDAGVDRPIADVAIDEELVARLVAAQHPDLAHGRAGSGDAAGTSSSWDRAVSLAGMIQ